MTAPSTHNDIDGEALSALAKEIDAFAHTRAMGLGIDRDLVPNVLVSLVAQFAVNMHIGHQITVGQFDEAMRVVVPRLYDACLSLQDWRERKAPWRMQSKEMRDIGKTGETRRYGRIRGDA